MVSYDVWVETQCSPDLHKIYADVLAEAIAELLEREKRSWDDVRWVVPPPLPGEFMELLMKRCPPLRDKLIAIAAATGDRLSTSVPFGWEALLKERTPGRGEYGLILTVGAGVQAGVASYYY
jgi:3-oxoacyl-[acyl-carrier-protein] synthase III